MTASARYAMPTRASEPDLLVDTSVAVALVLADHEHHKETLEVLANRKLGLAGHAAFETHSILTRLPPPARRSPHLVTRLLSENFPGTRFLSAERAGWLLAFLGKSGLGGGSVYDALVGAAAAESGLRLATRDRRAIPTYRALEVDLEILGA